ncbi:MAG: DNA repair exonuclease [Alphaproteobacteria bacterium]
MPFRFVHTADIHLDSPLKSLALRDVEIAEIVGNATRQALERTIDLCLEEDVDALLIAGDLFDGDQRSVKTAIFLSTQMRRLTKEGIRVFIIRGNHDAESGIARHLSLPDGVHVFTGHGGVVEIDDRDVAIHGVSFARPELPESLLPKYRQPLPDCNNIGLLHTSLAGAEGHDVYAPCSLADLTAQGFDYWALGHVHKRQIYAETPCTVVMPGMPQGRDIGESGPKSVTLVTIADDGSISLDERMTGVAQFERLSLDLTGQDEWSDVLRAIERALEEGRGDAVSDHLIARIDVIGQTHLASRLRRDADVLLGEARQAAAAVGRTSVEKLSVDVRPPVVTVPTTGHDPLTELRTLMTTDVLTSNGHRAAARAAIEELQRQLPPELRSAFGDSDTELDRTIARLIRQGGEDVLARFDAGERPT